MGGSRPFWGLYKGRMLIQQSTHSSEASQQTTFSSAIVRSLQSNMKLIVLLSIIGAISGTPLGGGYMFHPVANPPPAPTTEAPKPPPATYTKTYYATAPVQHYSFHPIATPAIYAFRPAVTGSLYNYQDTHGAYKFSYSTSDGQSKTENKLADGGVSGGYSYIDPEGKRIELSYVADRDGFRATGNHLPVAPRVPDLPADLAQAYEEAYQRLYKAHEEARLRGNTEHDDGSYKAEEKPAVPMPVPAPVFYHTYVASPVQVATYHAFPAKSGYTSYVAPPAPAPVDPTTPAPKPVFSSASYSTNVGGEVVPVPVPATPAMPVPMKTKSAYVGHSY